MLQRVAAAAAAVAGVAPPAAAVSRRGGECVRLEWPGGGLRALAVPLGARHAALHLWLAPAEDSAEVVLLDDDSLAGGAAAARIGAAAARCRRRAAAASRDDEAGRAARREAEAGAALPGGRGGDDAAAWRAWVAAVVLAAVRADGFEAAAVTGSLLAGCLAADFRRPRGEDGRRVRLVPCEGPRVLVLARGAAAGGDGRAATAVLDGVRLAGLRPGALQRAVRLAVRPWGGAAAGGGEGLAALPLDAVELSLSFLPARDVARSCASCRVLDAAARAPELWDAALARELPGVSALPGGGRAALARNASRLAAGPRWPRRGVRWTEWLLERLRARGARAL